MSAAPIKVLVIDDEPPIRKLLRMGLTTQGSEILEAPNGAAALAGHEAAAVAKKTGAPLLASGSVKANLDIEWSDSAQKAAALAQRDAATAQALNAQTYDDSGARFQRLNQPMGQINSTTDMKSIGELQARIEIENGMLLNELIKLQSMNALIDNSRRVQQQHETQDGYKLTAAKY